ncbi:hypothetical protein CAOG_07937 [Capsaspora owczarzaki ATCC 30864]|uniref:Amino acid transporter transmembrane domain-containing protein n=1 Tax=Capsaspora owczarzaki (strain ATCC 30864) TaxID=595528 RepID=A0A0D2WXF0_CAPO3|nr:hypothetical protein CAOG_07937 [Capsaspora owczarzaki ATCC 30864]KJE97855.1 hypothetical protein CAOG_007937 [Capsaspora owczarzaki ATCC 30864]|eukprot:XP_004343025.1 hypothetical protein CAOG_07937 [Capsaspora owczarzaki ATCC 30864]
MSSSPIGEAAVGSDVASFSTTPAPDFVDAASASDIASASAGVSTTSSAVEDWQIGLSNPFQPSPASTSSFNPSSSMQGWPYTHHPAAEHQGQQAQAPLPASSPVFQLQGTTATESDLAWTAAHDANAAANPNANPAAGNQHWPPQQDVSQAQIRPNGTHQQTSEQQGGVALAQFAAPTSPSHFASAPYRFRTPSTSSQRSPRKKRSPPSTSDQNGIMRMDNDDDDDDDDDDDYNDNNDTSVNGHQVFSDDGAGSSAEFGSGGGRKHHPEAEMTPAQRRAARFLVPGAVFNLMNYIVGAGILGLPFAFRHAGLGVGLFLLLLVSFVTIYSFALLLWSARMGNAFTYETLALRSMGPHAATAVKVIIIIDSFGPLSAYMVIVTDAIRDFALSVADGSDSVMTNRAFLGFLCLVCFILPLCLLKNMRYLELTSLLSLLPLVYLIILQLVYFAENGIGGDLSFGGTIAGFFQSLPIFIFAFSSQQALFPIYNELKHPIAPDDLQHRDSLARKVVTFSVAAAASAYVFSGLFGYLQYPQTAEGNILLNYPDSTATTILLLSTSISIILSYPVIVFPCRYSVDRLLFPNSQQSYRRFAIETVCIVSVGYLVAIAVPELATVIGLFGGLTSTTIAYVLPPLFYIRIAPLNIRADRRKMGAIALLVLGSAAGLTSAIIILQQYIEEKTS